MRKICERLGDQIAQEERRARPHETDEGRQLEMHLPDDRRKEFVISIDTAHVPSADSDSARSFELIVARCGRRGRGEPGGRYFVPSTGRWSLSSASTRGSIGIPIFGSERGKLATVPPEVHLTGQSTYAVIAPENSSEDYYTLDECKIAI